jgi:hypothetical protein
MKRGTSVEMTNNPVIAYLNAEATRDSAHNLNHFNGLRKRHGEGITGKLLQKQSNPLHNNSKRFTRVLNGPMF